jgi:hypothetical protein
MPESIIGQSVGPATLGAETRGMIADTAVGEHLYPMTLLR